MNGVLQFQVGDFTKPAIRPIVSANSVHWAIIKQKRSDLDHHSPDPGHRRSNLSHPEERPNLQPDSARVRGHRHREAKRVSECSEDQDRTL